MDRLLDRFVLMVGRRLPLPLRVLVSSAWWILFVLVMASVSTDTYAALGSWLSRSMGAPGIPEPDGLIAWFFAFTAAQLVHSASVRRRDELTGKPVEPLLRDEDLSVVQRRRQMYFFTAFFILIIAVMAWTVVRIDQDAARNSASQQSDSPVELIQ